MKTVNNFTEGNILKSLMQFAMPILFTLFLQAAYGAVDLAVVGKFCSSADVSAVSTGSQMMLIITGFITGLSMGVTILLGQKIGNNESKEAGDVIGSSICLFLSIGLVLTVLMLMCSRFFVGLMHTPVEAYEKAISYVLICSSGTIFIVAYNVISSIFRGMGNSRLPLVFVFIACIVNIVGDLLFVVVFKMDAAGAALATIIAQAVSVVLSIVIIKKHGLPFSFGKKNVRFNIPIMKQIVNLGMPIALQDMFTEVSFLIIIAIVNSLGLIASAGVGVAERIVMFMLLIPMSYMSSVSAFVAQNIGAQKHDRARKVMWCGISTAFIFGLIIFIISFWYGDVLSSFFSKDIAVIQASADFLKATAIECLILSVAFCFTGYFNGRGKTVFVMVQGLCATFLVRIPYAYYASKIPGVSMFQIGLSASFAAVFTLIVCVIYYLYIMRKSGVRKI